MDGEGASLGEASAEGASDRALHWQPVLVPVLVLARGLLQVVGLEQGWLLGWVEGWLRVVVVVQERARAWRHASRRFVWWCSCRRLCVGRLVELWVRTGRRSHGLALPAWVLPWGEVLELGRQGCDDRSVGDYLAR